MQVKSQEKIISILHRLEIALLTHSMIARIGILTLKVLILLVGSILMTSCQRKEVLDETRICSIRHYMYSILL